MIALTLASQEQKDWLVLPLMRSSNFRKNTFFHLRLVNNTPTINSISMLFDLANYIKDYQASLAKEEELNRKFAENLLL